MFVGTKQTKYKQTHNTHAYIYIYSYIYICLIYIYIYRCIHKKKVYCFRGPSQNASDYVRCVSPKSDPTKKRSGLNPITRHRADCPWTRMNVAVSIILRHHAGHMEKIEHHCPGIILVVGKHVARKKSSSKGSPSFHQRQSWCKDHWDCWVLQGQHSGKSMR